MDLAGNLGIIAAAVEQLTAAAVVSADFDQSGASAAASLSPTRRPKLVLPTLTPAMQQDFVLSKSGAINTKPLSISMRPEFADYPLRGIVTPHSNDVCKWSVSVWMARYHSFPFISQSTIILHFCRIGSSQTAVCGRGGGSNNHPGNECFRELVNEVKVSYVNCPKRDKPLIARQIVEAVRNQTPPGRFLSKDSKGVWNDIGDGRAREKTSQALREGAPVIRIMAGRPVSPKIAAAMKEEKKAERSEKKCGVTHPEKKSEEFFHSNPTTAQPQVKNEPSSINPEKCTVDSPPTVVVNRSGPMTLFDGSFGKHDVNTTLWPHAHRLGGRNFSTVPYSHNNTRHMMGGFSAPSHGFMDHSFGLPKYPDYVPIGVVRRLLLGQLDPVQLACQLLPPEEAARVARRHRVGLTSNSHPIVPLSSMAAPGAVSNSSIHPLMLNPQVSDASSTTESSMHRTQSDVSSVDSPKPSRSNVRHSLPKKKRKYVENMDL